MAFAPESVRCLLMQTEPRNKPKRSVIITYHQWKSYNWTGWIFVGIDPEDEQKQLDKAVVKPK